MSQLPSKVGLLTSRCWVDLKYPWIGFTDHFLLFWSNVQLNVEHFLDLIRLLALDHASYFADPQVQQGWDIQIIGSKDNFKEGFLGKLNEVGIPFTYNFN